MSSSMRELPQLVPLPKAPATFGLSRSAIYRGSKEGIVLRKLGRSTLVETDSILRYIANLPRAGAR
jgi:predicted DNA-binding transcriptional regulator AlpA